MGVIVLSVPLDQAMRLYYTSKLADFIHDGSYGIQYLDYNVLTDLLEEEIQNHEKLLPKQNKEPDLSFCLSQALVISSKFSFN